MPITTSGGSSGGASVGALYAAADNSLTLGSAYALKHGLLRLAVPTDFSTTIADAAASPPSGWTWIRSTGLDSADANTTTANALRMNHDTTSTNFSSQNEPYLAKVVSRAPDNSFEVIARIKASSGAAFQNYEQFGVRIADKDASNSGYCANLLHATNHNAYVYWLTTGSPSATLTAENYTTGVWVRAVLREDRFHFYYSLTDQATPPDPEDWVLLGGSASMPDSDFGHELSVGLCFSTQNTTGDLSIDLMYWDDSMNIDVDGRAYGAAAWSPGSEGYDQNNTEIQIMTDFDLGAAGATVTDADVQNVLRDCENLFGGDSASWTYSVVRDASEGASAGSYAAAASATVSGSGKFLNIFAKASSDGTQAASFDMARLLIPYSPA